MTQPCDLDAVEARRLIGAKKLSPVELMDSCLQRIAATNKKVNSVVAMDEALAKRTAKAAETAVMKGEPLGALHGLPVGIKDLEMVKGMRSTYGSKLFENHVPEADTPMVASVRAAGGNIFAKTNTPEFGAGGNTRNLVYGATGNPFDVSLTAGGSSGGAAAAVAVGQMPLATGSDYGGSLRTPATFCGVVGFRPSPGVVPAPDRAAGLIPWGVLGPMGRTVADAALLLRAQVGVDRADPYSSTLLEMPERLTPADLASTRAAITPDFGAVPVSKSVRSVFADRTKRMQSIIGITGETTPDFSGIHDIFEVHRGLAFASGHQDKVAQSRDKLDRNVIDNTERGLKLTASEIGRGFIEQHKLARRVLAFFDRYDVLISPASSVPPFPHKELFVTEMDGTKMETYMRWLAICYAPTMALCCVACIPCGRDEKGLPFGIQVIGARGSDLKVLQVAMALEEAFAGDATTARAVPDLTRLTA